MKIAGIIPARYASSRFPGKPLALIHNKPMIQHVYEQASKADQLDDLIVATDDSRIEKVVKEFGGKVMMTEPTHSSGTERCAEIQKTLKLTGNSFDVIINIQGDEPFIDPKQIDLVASCFNERNVQIATLAKKIENEKELFDPNVVKIVTDINDKAIYFSRQTLPYIRGQKIEYWIQSSAHYKHIGIYGYQSAILEEIVALKKTPLEDAESLEQLRWIENGYSIKVKETTIESYGVDVPEDLSKFSN
jgi:3-deoxy-manno-octulosonate cytidylyltransferase (CMP-KDO synthetase)